MFTNPFTFQKQAGGGTLSCVVQCFTANGTWSCCSGATCIEVVAVAGGGGGGPGSPGTSSNASTCMRSGGPGGGAGGVVVCTLTSGFGTSQCVIIGTGGAAGVGGSNLFGTPTCSGGNGGASCFGALVVATGGGGGQPGQSATWSPGRCISGGVGGNDSPNGAYACVSNVYGENGSGGSATGKPGSGGAGFGSGYQTAEPETGGGGGSTICGITLGNGGNGGGGGAAGSNGSGFGAAGGGGSKPNDYFCNSFNGGAGAAGIIQVTQYILS